MNELTGAFLIAQEKGENLLITRQSLANSGYPIQEIEQALMEAKQILAKKNSTPIQIIQPKKKKNWVIFLIIFLSIAIMGFSIFLFWDKIIGLFGGN